MAATSRHPPSTASPSTARSRSFPSDKPLLRYLRDDLKLTSVKDGCSEGACGTCTVLVDDRATKACVLTTRLANGRDIVTVEGLPHEEQEAFVYAFGAVGAVQCGFCIPGMVMAGAALIHKVPDPTEDQVKVAIRGNVCRCTGYKKIIEGILLAAAILRGEKSIDPELERGDDYGVGKRAFRVDVRRKVLGYGKYPDDIDERDFPDLTYASAVRSKRPRARVVKIDAEKARAMPGRPRRAHRRRRAGERGRPPALRLGRHDRRGRRHALRGRRHRARGGRGRRDAREGQEGREGGVRGARAGALDRGGPRRGRARAPRARTSPSATGSRPRTTSASSATWSAATLPRRSRAPRTR